MTEYEFKIPEKYTGDKSQALFAGDVAEKNTNKKSLSSNKNVSLDRKWKATTHLKIRHLDQ